MSSIKDAITQATRDALSSYLAPELVESLTEEIIQRAAPQMEEALRAMAGFDLGRPGTVRQKPAQVVSRKLNKAGKKPKKEREDDAPVYLTGSVDSPSHNGGGAAESPMHLS
jgi:hypothetical protein